MDSKEFKLLYGKLKKKFYERLPSYLGGLMPKDVWIYFSLFSMCVRSEAPPYVFPVYRLFK